MNREDIIRMAQEIASQYSKAERFQTWTHDYMMQRLMELVEAEHERIEHAAIDSVKAAILYEREACADVCEQYGFDNHCGTTTDVIATAIRARGQA